MTVIEVYDIRHPSYSSKLVQTFYLNVCQFGTVNNTDIPDELLWYYETNKDPGCIYYGRWKIQTRPLTATEQVLYVDKVSGR